MMPRCISVAIHDVGEARLVACRRLMATLQTVASGSGIELPVTLLVAPMFNGSAPGAMFISWLREQIASGHEMALHGYTHRNDLPMASSWSRRNHDDGEFESLGRREAQWRIDQARQWAIDHRLPFEGFIAPSWRMSADALDAVEAAGFHYTCTRNHLLAFPGRRSLHARALSFETRPAWRRSASIVVNSALAAAQSGQGLMRLEIKPEDVEYEAVEECLVDLLRNALEGGRLPLRLDDAAMRFCHSQGDRDSSHSGSTLSPAPAGEGT